jgi:hypothetical protein
MPVKYIVVDNGNLVIERWKGKISDAERLEHERQQLKDRSIKRGARVLVDARQASFRETTLNGLHELTDLYVKLQSRLTASKCALLVSDKDWPLAKAFETGADKRGLTIITFNELSTACSWLGIDLRMVRDHLKKLSFNKQDAGDD